MAPATVLSGKEHLFGVGDGGSADAMGEDFHFLFVRGSVVGNGRAKCLHELAMTEDVHQGIVG